MNPPHRAKSVTLMLPAARVPEPWMRDPSFARAIEGSALWQHLRRAPALQHWREETLAPQGMAHQRWLADRFALDSPAALCAASALFDDVSGARWRLYPVSLCPGLDRLSLASVHDTDLAADDAAALATSATELLAGDGWSVHVAASGRWYLLGPDALSIDTRAPEAALTRNVDAFQPQGADARRWRARLAEIEMSWHLHPVNQRREQHGQPPVNSLWLSGPVPRPLGEAGGEATDVLPTRGGAPRQAFSCVVSDDPALVGAARRVGARTVSVADALADASIAARTGALGGSGDDPRSGTGGGVSLLAPFDLLAPLLAQDPARWLAALDAQVAQVAAVAARMARQTGTGLELVLCGDLSLATVVARPRDRLRAWRRHAPATVFAETANGRET